MTGALQQGEHPNVTMLLLILVPDNCETVSDCYESGQNKQMAAQNRFEFASNLFILPELWLSMRTFRNFQTRSDIVFL